MADRCSRDQVIDLLSLASAFDQRTVGDADVTAWFLVSQRERWTAAAAQRVLVEYYSQDAGRPRISPAAITDGIRHARRRAARVFVPPRIPDGVPAGEYPRWYRAQLHAFQDRVVAEWAAGGDIPVEAVELEAAPSALRLEQAPAEARAEIERYLPRIGSGPRRAARPGRATPADLDPRRRADARAELDAVRPQQEPAVDQQGRDSA